MGQNNMMAGWDAPSNVGVATGDPYVRLLPLDEVLRETQKLVDGTSEVVQRRIKLLSEVENLLSL